MEQITERSSSTADNLATVELLNPAGEILATGQGFGLADARRSAYAQLPPEPEDDGRCPTCRLRLHPKDDLCPGCGLDLVAHYS